MVCIEPLLHFVSIWVTGAPFLTRIKNVGLSNNSKYQAIHNDKVSWPSHVLADFTDLQLKGWPSTQVVGVSEKWNILMMIVQVHMIKDTVLILTFTWVRGYRLLVLFGADDHFEPKKLSTMKSQSLWAQMLHYRLCMYSMFEVQIRRTNNHSWQYKIYLLTYFFNIWLLNLQIRSMCVL